MKLNGLGNYVPVDGIIMEHGHRYDFFNCPQPLAKPGHILPPGYFITRLYAQGMMEQGKHPLKELMSNTGSFEFTVAWEATYLYILLHFSMTVAADSANIKMGGIDGYVQQFSFNGVRDMYATNIEDLWPATQAGNNVAVPSPCCLHALWNSASNLFSAAKSEYMIKPPAPVTYKIVSFGHTHQPMLEVYPSGKNYTSVYSNSGAWVDADVSSYKVRTYLIISPGQWTGSEIDIVALYQYNFDSDGGNPTPGFKPVLISEESIYTGN